MLTVSATLVYQQYGLLVHRPLMSVGVYFAAMRRP